MSGADIQRFKEIFSNFCRKLDINGKIFNQERIDIFCETANIKTKSIYEELITTPDLMHSFVCFLKTFEIKNIPLKLKQNSDYCSLIVEDRCLPHLECLIRNTIIKTPNDWCHNVVCTQINFEAINKVCKDIHADIKVIPVSVPGFTQNSYNDMLLSPWFWEKINSENILIYQQDTFLFREGIEEFYDYDYIGAPWLQQQTDNENGVGNGGFSLRKKSKMLKCLATIKPSELNLSDDTTRYMKNSNLRNPPEDVFFSKTLIEYNIGNVANRETASQFSEEREFSVNPLGGHQYWLANCEELFRSHVPLRMVDWSYFDGESSSHRSGWKSLLHYMIKNQTLRRDCGTAFVDIAEKYFVWDSQPALTNEWIGISHMVPNTPEYLQIADIERLIENENFKKSLPTCKCLIVLSDYMKRYLQHRISPTYNLKIVSLKHPTANDIKEFDIRKFYSNKNKKVIFLGQQMRKISSIYLLKTKRKKWWMYGHPDKKLMIRRRNDEFKMLKVYPNAHSVELVNERSNANYDKIITENIILMDFLDASANNAIVECMSANIPFFTNRLPAIEEYLGKDYPMYFNDLSEVENIIDDDVKLNEIYTQTTLYLMDIDKSELAYGHFCNKLIKIIN